MVISQFLNLSSTDWIESTSKQISIPYYKILFSHKIIFTFRKYGIFCNKVIWARKKLGLMGEDGTQVGQLESWNLFVASFLYTSGATRCLILI